jgi:hypothetical protein
VNPKDQYKASFFGFTESIGINHEIFFLPEGHWSFTLAVHTADVKTFYPPKVD